MISNKLIGLAALVFLCGSVSIGVVGCDDDATADDDGDDDDDAGPTTSSSSSSGRPSSSGASGTTSSSGGDVEAPACYDDSAAGIQFGNGVESGQGVCTDAQAQQFLDLCFTSDADDAGEADDAGASDAGTPCDAFIAANSACVTCIFPLLTVPEADASDGTKVQAYLNAHPAGSVIIADDEGHVTTNRLACVASLSTGDAACKKSYLDLVSCAQNTCGTCSDDDTFSACISYSTTPDEVCGSNFPVTDDCNTSFEAITEDAITAACGPTDTFEGAYAAITKHLCGAQ